MKNSTDLEFMKRQILVLEYRLLKVLERSAHRYTPDVSKEVSEIVSKDEVKNEYIRLVMEVSEKNFLSTESYFESKELGVQAALHRLLRDNGSIAEAVAEINWLKSHGQKPTHEDIIEDINYLKYCLDNPKEMNKYKVPSGTK